MSNVIKLKKGLDIRLLGEAEKFVTLLQTEGKYLISPLDFEGVTPKLLVKVGDEVVAGSALFFDKNRTEVLFTSPVSGVVAEIKRGEKRKILSVIVVADKEQKQKEFPVKLAKLQREDMVKLLLESGLWSMIVQRPYGIIANPTHIPKAIFVSGFDSAPLAADMNLVLKDEIKNLQKGVEILSLLTEGKVHLGLKYGSNSVLEALNGVDKHYFKGAHPAGNVGVQIHHIAPINKGETVWTVDVQNLAIIGRFFLNGKVDMTKIIALTGSELIEPQYIKMLVGTSMSNAILPARIKPPKNRSRFRIIGGNVLTGRQLTANDGLGFYANQITVIPERGKDELFGWLGLRLNKLSVSKLYFSWLQPKKVYNLDTSVNGGERPFVMSGVYEKYLPMDILPVYLLKAILAEDIDKMESLGIYEVVEEDFALCEFVDPSKQPIQQIIKKGIDLMIKELN